MKDSNLKTNHNLHNDYQYKIVETVGIKQNRPESIEYIPAMYLESRPQLARAGCWRGDWARSDKSPPKESSESGQWWKSMTGAHNIQWTKRSTSFEATRSTLDAVAMRGRGQARIFNRQTSTTPQMAVAGESGRWHTPELSPGGEREARTPMHSILENMIGHQRNSCGSHMLRYNIWGLGCRVCWTWLSIIKNNFAKYNFYWKQLSHNSTT